MWVTILIVVSALWVAFDAYRLGVKRGSGFSDMGPVGWCFACLLLWIVAFPMYLVKRPKYKLRLAQKPNE